MMQTQPDLTWTPPVRVVGADALPGATSSAR